MNLIHTTHQIMKLSTTLVVALAVQCVGNMQAASAQGLANPDTDSLLPPEVVPLEPSAASKMVQSQAQSRQAAMSSPYMNTTPASTPGLTTDNGANNYPGGTMSAQDFRKAAFNSVMGVPQSQMPQQALGNPSFQGMQGQMGQMPGQYQPGQQSQPWTAPGMADNQTASLTQSQTLSAGQKNPEVGKPSKLSGLAHGASLATSLGGGLMLGAMMGFRNPAGLYPLGLYGLGLGSYTMMNGLSHW